MNIRAAAAIALIAIGAIIVWFFLWEWVLKVLGIVFAVLCIWAGFRLLFRPSIGGGKRGEVVDVEGSVKHE